MIDDKEINKMSLRQVAEQMERRAETSTYFQAIDTNHIWLSMGTNSNIELNRKLLSI